MPTKLCYGQLSAYACTLSVFFDEGVIGFTFADLYTHSDLAMWTDGRWIFQLFTLHFEQHF